MKLLMLINAHSGVRNSKAKLIDALDIFSAHGYDVSVYVTQKKNDAYDYLLKCKESYDVLCVFGGDGTMNEVTNALMQLDHKPLLGYFPSGTMNDFGSNFDLGTDFKHIAERICAGEVREFDVGQFNDSFFNYVAAFGAMCDVPFTTNRESKEILGNVAYILEGINKLPEIRSHHVTYQINGREYTKDVLFGLIYSGNQVAGMQLAERKNGKIDDGNFNVLIVDYVQSFLNTPDVLTTLINQKRYIHHYFSGEISLCFDDDIIWTLDGEEAHGQKADIVIHNKALKMLA